MHTENNAASDCRQAFPWKLEHIRAVAAHPILNINEKLIWITLACESLLNPHTTHNFSHRSIEKIFGDANNPLNASALRILMVHGFLMEIANDYRLCFKASHWWKYNTCSSQAATAYPPTIKKNINLLKGPKKRSFLSILTKLYW